jgi:hypothetical protein
MWKSFCRIVHAQHARLASYVLGVRKKEHEIHFDRFGVETENAAVGAQLRSFWRNARLVVCDVERRT